MTIEVRLKFKGVYLREGFYPSRQEWCYKCQAMQFPVENNCRESNDIMLSKLKKIQRSIANFITLNGADVSTLTQQEFLSRAIPTIHFRTIEYLWFYGIYNLIRWGVLEEDENNGIVIIEC